MSNEEFVVSDAVGKHEPIDPIAHRSGDACCAASSRCRPTMPLRPDAAAGEPAGHDDRRSRRSSEPNRRIAVDACGAKSEPEHEPQGIAVAVEDDDRPVKMDWYILKVQSNREDSIRDGLKRHVQMAGLEKYFADIIVPIETVTEFKGGKKKSHQAKAVSGLPRRADGNQRRHVVLGARNAGHRRFHRLDRPARRRWLTQDVTKILSKTRREARRMPRD